LEEKEILKLINNPETKYHGFNRLVIFYQERVYHLARKMVIDHEDANDIVQEVFIKIYKNLSGFQHKSSLFTWIYRITSNECLIFLRKRKLRNWLRLSQIRNLSDLVDSGSHVEADEIQKKLQKAILRLPDKQRLVFNLKYYENIKYEDMAKITGTSEGALKASYHLAVKKIEEFLQFN